MVLDKNSIDGSYEIIWNLPVTESVRENTIPVVTTTPIAGHIIDNVQPPAMANPGHLFIRTAADAPTNFNAVKNNGIIVRPAEALQLIGNEYRNVMSFICKGDNWIRLIDGMIYDRGFLHPQTDGISTNNANVNLQSDHIMIQGDGSAYKQFTTTNEIDLTGFDTLEMVYTIPVAANDSNGGLSVLNTGATTISSANSTKRENFPAATFKATHSLDISSVTGMHRIGVRTQAGLSTSQFFRCYRLRLY